MHFDTLGIIDPILKSLSEQGYEKPTPIQQQSIPLLLEGKDMLGCAQTGTGKTAAFAIPIIQQLSLNPIPQRTIRALVVTPTRELAIQIHDSFRVYGNHTKVRSAVIFGGVKQGAQVATLRRGVDVLVATPGRLLDLIGQGIIHLRDVKHFVLDEADQMLDMGFIHDIKKLLKLLPSKRQSLFFSATMPENIVELAEQILYKPESVTIQPRQKTAERIGQTLYYVSKGDKPDLLVHLLKTHRDETVLVFSKTKHGADKIVKYLNRNRIDAAAIHGNKSQTARQKALGDFKDGRLKVLIATDIAARGIDVDELSLVINYNLPHVPETYVHRIGRTGRASASGDAISFCEEEEKICLRDIERLIKQSIEVVTEHPFHVEFRQPSRIISKQPQRPDAPSKKKRQWHSRQT